MVFFFFFTHSNDDDGVDYNSSDYGVQMSLQWGLFTIYAPLQKYFLFFCFLFNFYSMNVVVCYLYVCLSSAVFILL